MINLKDLLSNEMYEMFLLIKNSTNIQKVEFVEPKKLKTKHIIMPNKNQRRDKC